MKERGCGQRWIEATQPHAGLMLGSLRHPGWAAVAVTVFIAAVGALFAYWRDPVGTLDFLMWIASLFGIGSWVASLGGANSEAQGRMGLTMGLLLWTVLLLGYLVFRFQRASRRAAGLSEAPPDSPLPSGVPRPGLPPEPTRGAVGPAFAPQDGLTGTEGEVVASKHDRTTAARNIDSLERLTKRLDALYAGKVGESPPRLAAIAEKAAKALEGKPAHVIADGHTACRGQSQLLRSEVGDLVQRLSRAQNLDALLANTRKAVAAYKEATDDASFEEARELVSRSLLQGALWYEFLVKVFATHTECKEAAKDDIALWESAFDDLVKNEVRLFDPLERLLGGTAAWRTAAETQALAKPLVVPPQQVARLADLARTIKEEFERDYEELVVKGLAEVRLGLSSKESERIGLSAVMPWSHSDFGYRRFAAEWKEHASFFRLQEALNRIPEALDRESFEEIVRLCRQSLQDYLKLREACEEAISGRAGLLRRALAMSEEEVAKRNARFDELRSKLDAFEAKAAGLDRRLKAQADVSLDLKSPRLTD